MVRQELNQDMELLRSNIIVRLGFIQVVATELLFAADGGLRCGSHR